MNKWIANTAAVLVAATTFGALSTYASSDADLTTKLKAAWTLIDVQDVDDAIQGRDIEMIAKVVEEAGFEKADGSGGFSGGPYMGMRRLDDGQIFVFTYDNISMSKSYADKEKSLGISFPYNVEAGYVIDPSSNYHDLKMQPYVNVTMSAVLKKEFLMTGEESEVALGSFNEAGVSVGSINSSFHGYFKNDDSDRLRVLRSLMDMSQSAMGIMEDRFMKYRSKEQASEKLALLTEKFFAKKDRMTEVATRHRGSKIDVIGSIAYVVETSAPVLIQRQIRKSGKIQSKYEVKVDSPRYLSNTIDRTVRAASKAPTHELDRALIQAAASAKALLDMGDQSFSMIPRE